MESDGYIFLSTESKVEREPYPGLPSFRKFILSIIPGWKSRENIREEIGLIKHSPWPLKVRLRGRERRERERERERREDSFRFLCSGGGTRQFPMGRRGKQSEERGRRGRNLP